MKHRPVLLQISRVFEMSLNAVYQMDIMIDAIQHSSYKIFFGDEGFAMRDGSFSLCDVNQRNERSRRSSCFHAMRVGYERRA